MRGWVGALPSADRGRRRRRQLHRLRPRSDARPPIVGAAAIFRPADGWADRAGVGTYMCARRACPGRRRRLPAAWHTALWQLGALDTGGARLRPNTQYASPPQRWWRWRGAP
eukprot:scaffold99_cov382-Prasinococcus_capsulatus_cf.AAC.6